MIKTIGTLLPITVVDLRQESHGFINGLAVSWKGLENDSNKGLTRKQVLEDEVDKLNSVNLNIPITFYNHHKTTIDPIKVQNENELVKDESLSYIRITVKDGGLPSDDMVDYFMEFVKIQLQNNCWLHFHCKAGVGRTMLFIIMYDIVKNYKDVCAMDIINRQLALAKFDEEKSKSFRSGRKFDFLDEFYNYCKVNGDSFETKWSEWKNIY